MTVPEATSILTWAVVCPFVTCRTLPLITLRALSFMENSCVSGPLLYEGKAVLCQYLLPRRRQDEFSQAPGGGARPVHDGQPVLGADGQRLRQLDHLETR